VTRLTTHTIDKIRELESASKWKVKWGENCGFGVDRRIVLDSLVVNFTVESEDRIFINKIDRMIDIWYPKTGILVPINLGRESIFSCL
jgi:hypothetical protein